MAELSVLRANLQTAIRASRLVAGCIAVSIVFGVDPDTDEADEMFLKMSKVERSRAAAEIQHLMTEVMGPKEDRLAD